MVANLPKYTYDDYRQWKGDWELIDGSAVSMAPSPFGKHQRLLGRLTAKFNQELEKSDCECEAYPELDWIIDTSNVLRPDLAIYCEKIEEYPKTTPKIIVEIISPSKAINYEEIKFKIYEKEGVEYYILAYPEFKKVRIFKLTQRKYKKIYEGSGKFKFTICDIEIDFGLAFK